jgi:hypothetical protein
MAAELKMDCKIRRDGNVHKIPLKSQEITVTWVGRQERGEMKRWRPNKH